MVSQTKMTGVPGTIVAWHDSVAYVMGRDASNVPVFYQYWPGTGRRASVVLGNRGTGVFLSVAPDGRTILVQEPDSTGMHRLLTTTLPAAPPDSGNYSALWIDHLPVTDVDPHVTWYADSQSFLYQDILDDPKSTPSVFRFRAGDKFPKLYLFGCSRPLLAPTGDAVVCVGVDTLNPGTARIGNCATTVDVVGAGGLIPGANVQAWSNLCVYGATSKGEYQSCMDAYKERALASGLLVGNQGGKVMACAARILK